MIQGEGEDPRTPEEVAEDLRFDQRIKAAISSPEIAGPDPSVIEDIMNQAPIKAPTEAEKLAARSQLDARLQEIYADIWSRNPEHAFEPTLDRVRDVLALIGNPERNYHAIHITGTNGKTTTARIIEALLRERGLRTGRFTSPHLEDMRERISIDGRAISREDFIDTWDDVKPYIDIVDKKSVAAGGPRLSFFEVLTVMAYDAFSNAPIDVAVVEVGMGGEWDATNVINADVAVLLPVALDHMEWLGNTIEEIADTKLGILKRGKILVSAAQRESVVELSAARAEENHARYLLENRDFRVIHRETAVGGEMVTITTPAATYTDIPLGLRGAFQAHNAAVALVAVEAFFDGSALPGDVVERALMSVSSPGRLEVVRTSPLVVVDGGHNPHAAQAQVSALREYYPQSKIVGVVAQMSDKDQEDYLGVLEPVLASVVVTGMESARAMDPEQLGEIARGVFGEDRVVVEPDLAEAIDHATAIAETDSAEDLTPPVVVALGSFELVGNVRALMGKANPDEA